MHPSLWLGWPLATNERLLKMKNFPRKGTFPSPIQQDHDTGLALHRREIFSDREDPFRKVVGAHVPLLHYVNLGGLPGFIVA